MIMHQNVFSKADIQQEWIYFTWEKKPDFSLRECDLTSLRITYFPLPWWTTWWNSGHTTSISKLYTTCGVIQIWQTMSNNYILHETISTFKWLIMKLACLTKPQWTFWVQRQHIHSKMKMKASWCGYTTQRPQRSTVSFYCASHHVVLQHVTDK